MRKRITALLLCLCLLLTAAIPVYAEEEEAAEVRKISISTVERLLSFAENCRLDSYSRDLVVTLEKDLDLTGVEFDGIPIFCGTFEGNGHTISGWELTAEGSQLGLFRYLTDTAEVRNLNLKANLQPGGSRGEIGGMAGSNAGRIGNCQFSGTVTGGDRVGGLVGINTLSGVIENCQVNGSVSGNHFVGGVAGTNNGVIRGCTNNAQINSTVQENTVSLSDITMDSLVNSESAQTVTDIGGITGNSSGVIRDCVNQGGVGYQHMGYNIGGIAGTQSGYIVDCENRAEILGRKEVGGIVGQMEPAALIEYDEDALQILQRQLNGLGSIVSQTTSNVQSTANNLTNQVYALHDHVQDAKDAVGMLLPDRDNPELPDLDTIQAAQNSLSSSMSGMTRTLEGMSATTQSAMGTLSNNLYAMQNQINAMSATLGNVSETLGGSITDVSDADTEADLTGKVESCVNHGSVLADRNVGGITGAIALENALDPEDDWQISGENSLNFQSQLRSVILNCENEGTVTAGKQNAGGIVGWQSLGLVKDCRNVGDLEAEGTDYVGGISGQSTGYIRNSSAKCTLTGEKYVGGIAGSAEIATDCRSMVVLEGTEKLGAVLGTTETNSKEAEIPISGNFYLQVFEDPGGIDGISYDGLAQSLTERDFFALEDLPELFQNVIITFHLNNGTVRRVTIPSGGKLETSQIPGVPVKEGFVGEWEGLEEADLTNIVFNLSFETHYTSYSAVIQSDTVRENGFPLLLVQGDFTENTVLTITETDAAPELEDKQTLLEAWQVDLAGSIHVTGGRLQLPEDCDTEHLSVLILGSDGSWTTVEHTLDGSYVAFPLEEDDDAIALVQTEPDAWPIPVAVAGTVLLAAVLLLILCKKKRPKKKASK
ncbi:MAG: GLUG motif-containing protein [Faecousia sp.]